MSEDYTPIWDIRNKDGKVTEGNEWAKNLAGKIGEECMKHGKGFVFCPFGGSNHTCKSFFATSLTNPIVFGAAMTMMLSNFIYSNPDIKDPENRKAFLRTVSEAAERVLKKMEQNNGKID